VSDTRLEVSLENESLATSNADEARWTELCVTAEQDMQDPLLIEVLTPFVRSEQAGRRVFFVRDRVDKTLRLRIWVSGCASGEVDELAGAFRAFAEQRTASVEVSVLPHTSLEGLLGPYGGPQATTLLSDFFVDLCGLILDQIAEVAAGRARRLSIALDIMVSHLHAIDIVRIFPERYPLAKPVHGCPSTFPVYRANVDGFFVMSTIPEVARERVNEQYERVGPSLRARVAEVLSQFHNGPIVSDVGLRWHRIANKHLLAADAAIARDGLTVKWDKGYIGDNFDLTVSPFHQVVQGSPPVRSYYKENQGYLAARFMVSSTYLALTSLGIRIMERFFLCHSITCACEELFAVDATTVIRQVAYAAEELGYSGE
jgi:hypothetical protein